MFGCFFSHKYKRIHAHVSKIYETQMSERPFKIETTFLFECKKCGCLKTQKVEGDFSSRDDDDDDDGGDEPQTPVLSPDDYYDQITK